MYVHTTVVSPYRIESREGWRERRVRDRTICCLKVSVALSYLLQAGLLAAVCVAVHMINSSRQQGQGRVHPGANNETLRHLGG